MKVQTQIIEGVRVVRDDLFPGGTKARFLPEFIGDAKEIVYASPFCGGAAVALSYLVTKGRRVTIFYAKRNELTHYQRIVVKNHAHVVQVPYGYMSNVVSKARIYALENNARFFDLGFDTQAAREILISKMRTLRLEIGSPEIIYCATGSGMLAKCIAAAFPDSAVMAVVVGRESRHDKAAYADNIQLLDCAYKFEQPSKFPCPFPSHPHYDRKAWEVLQGNMRMHAKAAGVLFWNVMG